MKIPKMLEFPQKVVSHEGDWIPADIWPNLTGVMEAKVVEWGSTLKDWQKFWKTARKYPLVSIDTETSGLRPFHGDRIVGVAASFYDGRQIQSGYWNFRHIGHPGYKETAPVIPPEHFKDMEYAFLCQINAGQNYKYDMRMFAVEGCPLPRRVICTMLLAHLWDENKKGYHLAGLAEEMGEAKMHETINAYMIEHHLDIKKYGHAQVPHKLEKPYAIRDTVLVLKRLQFERERWLKTGDAKLLDVFQIEMAANLAFASIEIRGSLLDKEFLKGAIKKLEGELEILRREIFKEAGKEFDIYSLDQLWQVLESRGHKPRSLTPSGKPSLTDQDLTNYNDPLCFLIKRYRAKYKMLNTYFLPFYSEHIDKEGRLHPDFFVHGTVSGRVSCREPNLQNITRFEKFGTRTKSGSIAAAIQSGAALSHIEDADSEGTLEVRRCFIPPKGFAMFFFDYAQMELRLFADYAQEPVMLAALERGGDIHEASAREVFPNFPEKEKDPKLYEYYRHLAKQVNFGIIYGMGRNRLAEQLNVPVDEALRCLELALLAAKQDPGLFKSCCTLTVEQLIALREDHRVSTQTRMWAGLRRVQREIQHRINPTPLEETLLKDPENLRLMYSAEKFLQRYHERFTNIKKFTKEVDQTLGKRGFLFNRYGRRYHLPRDMSYVGVNRLIQGSCGDMVKLAQVRLHDLELHPGIKSYFVNQVHDEVQAYIHHTELELVEEIRRRMEYYPEVRAKMKVDVDYTLTSWNEKHEWEGIEKFTKHWREHHGKKNPA